MPQPNYQNVKISRGRHSTPGTGACVMELTSMLAGERFSDKPMTACPVIGAFLRPYNDLSRDGDRQELAAIASRIVGSRHCDVEEARVRRCQEIALELYARPDMPNRHLKWRPSWRRALTSPSSEGERDAWAVVGQALAFAVHKLPDSPARAADIVYELVGMGEGHGGVEPLDPIAPDDRVLVR